ncbi:MAG: indolepyruvate ferredoxin oxidoreductase family protein [Bryobacteraceae bacterium]
MQLSDKYTQQSGPVYMTGIQALVRLPLDQMRLDRAAGLSTGCYITGYEGSPLGVYDFALERVRTMLVENNIHFQPALNEDLAATAIFGTQIFRVLGDQGKPKVDGVVGIWYGKGPGVDRSGDILRHGNLSGSPGLNAALVLAGDDHPCKSSSIPHQSDFSLYNVNIPILFPGDTQEILDYGLYAIAMSRHSGAWTSLKLLTQTCDGGGTVVLDPARHRYKLPTGYSKFTDPRLVPGIALNLEYETNVRRIPAALEFARLNPINTLHGARENARIGIATAGKYYFDLRQALSDCGIGEQDLQRLGIRIAKFGMTYPLEPGFVADFAAGLETVIVVEEKRSFLELQLRDALYNSAHRPAVLGKFDANGAPLLKPNGELDPDLVARALSRQLPSAQGIVDRLRTLDEIDRRPRAIPVLRTPTYCSGCPHNRSTLTFENQITGGGIGCHGMGFLMEDANRGYVFATHMGGEGAPWFGIEPFVERKHIFQNMGDGTYFHSGSLAIQAAVARGVNITYRILYNGHVAMTGGQDAVGSLPIPALTRKLEAEGVRRIVILSEFPERYEDPAALGRNTEVRDRSELERTMREMEEEAGVTVIIYDQECAAEKRRLRSRGKYAEPIKRLVIHEQVCEGCFDCVRQSNCVSLQPAKTPFGEKMTIHQPTCNKDYSCALGDCPSFVTVNLKPGTGLRKKPLEPLPQRELPAPARMADAGEGYRILSPGIGGTGVVTVNAILAAAATMDGLHVRTLDQTGLAQKGGAVVSHLILSRGSIAASARINAANADLMLGFDLLGVLAPDNFKCAHPDRTAAVVNTRVTPTAESIRKKLSLGDPAHRLAELERFTRRGHNVYVDAAGDSERYFGTHMMANMILLGAAWQAGLVPVSLASIEGAIRLNAVDVERNFAAFLHGRAMYLHPAPPETTPPAPADPDYAGELAAYQSPAYAAEFQQFVEGVRKRRPELAPAVARCLYKLMAIKDEYEVARLLTAPAFRQRLDEQWEAIESIGYNLHPPLLRRFGMNRKLQLGEWFQWPLRALAWARFVRGTAFDIFSWTKHRRRERGLVEWYRGLVTSALEIEDAERAREIVAIPDEIRGYEQVKEAAIDRAMKLAEAKLSTAGATAGLKSRAG